jgi:hypothetical protein
MAKHPNSLANLKSGRPKGALNKSTRDIQDFARRMLEDPEYVRELAVRLRRGKAPHVETVLYHYGYGKPRETISVENVPPFLFRIADDTRDE